MEQTMRCIFCKRDSSESRSVEHIIPESLGNTTALLRSGIVCDKCNNYFSREVEGPFLNSPALTRLRYQQGILSKRGRLPEVQGIVLPNHRAVLSATKNGNLPILTLSEASTLEEVIQNGHSQILFVPNDLPPSNSVTSRFLAKCGLETIAFRLQNNLDFINEVLQNTQFDPLRRHAREGTPKDWPCSIRRIYEEDRQVFDDDGNCLQTVHEFDILVTKNSEWFFIVAIFGLEFAINLGGPEIDGYEIWLNENKGKSPLYSGKNSIG